LLAGQVCISQRSTTLLITTTDACPLLQATLGCNWRAQLALAQAFPAFPALLSADAIHEHWTPIALGLVASGAQRVKPAAAAGLAAFLRAARKDRQRTDAYCRLVRELARGRGCWARMGFVEVAAASVRRFSARFFKVGRVLWIPPGVRRAGGWGGGGMCGLVDGCRSMHLSCSDRIHPHKKEHAKSATQQFHLTTR